jgi:predicted metal-dependent HD superfamily phosphohydrolase
MNEALRAQWAALRQSWVLDSGGWTALLENLGARYREPWRHYHDLHHVADCLAWVDVLGGPGNDRPVLELAVWFHDAVYDPRRRDNEARSAALAREQLGELGIPARTLDRVATLIACTAGHVAPDAAPDAAADADADADVLLDADLSILGAAPAAYDAYAAAIRREYAHVPAEAYRSGRLAVLERFLDRSWIYRTHDFRKSREAAARRNITREREHLRATDYYSG